jgi:hypothetical protein
MFFGLEWLETDFRAADAQHLFSCSYSNTFTNAFPACPVSLPGVLRSGSNAGFGIRALVWAVL